MITTPEQMREAAARLIETTAYTSNSDGRSLEPVSAGLVGMDMHHATIAAAIRAIPIAPQPVAVTVKPLVWEDDGRGNFRSQSSRGGEGVDRWTEPSVIGDDRAAYEAWGIDGVFDTPEEAQAAIEAEISAEILSALTIQPADPLSDPRVKALVEALKTTRDKLASMAHDQFDGVWTASDFEDETRDADAALRAIGGEA